MKRTTFRPTVICAILAAALTAVAGADEGRRPLLVTVDDLPMHASLHPDPVDRERITKEMLAVLDRHGVQAVGLVTWGNVNGPSDGHLLELWLEAGHELGNHSYRHPNLSRVDAPAFIADIERARIHLAELLERHDRRLRFFRYPFLREGNTRAKLDSVRTYLEGSGQRNLPVTIDNQDWSFERPWIEAVRSGNETAVTRVAEAYHESLHLSVRHHEANGDRFFGRPTPQILLLHGGAVGAAQWDRLLSWLEATGHRFASADEVLADEALSTPHAYVGPYGLGLWDRLRAERWASSARQEITSMLDEQAAAWSAGDLEAFCAVYADDAAFASPNGLTRGRQQVLDRYRLSYPDRAAMGQLSLEIIDLRLGSGSEVSMLGDAMPGRVHAASVLARWTLRREDGDGATGLTLLGLRRTPDGWKVVHDASF